MNENPELASTIKGKILVHVEAFDVEHPEKKVCSLKKGIRETAHKTEYFDTMV